MRLPISSATVRAYPARRSIERVDKSVTILDRFVYVWPNCDGHAVRMLQLPELAATKVFLHTTNGPVPLDVLTARVHYQSKISKPMFFKYSKVGS